jgi:hypothetical protein
MVATLPAATQSVSMHSNGLLPLKHHEQTETTNAQRARHPRQRPRAARPCAPGIWPHAAHGTTAHCGHDYLASRGPRMPRNIPGKDHVTSVESADSHVLTLSEVNLGKVVYHFRISDSQSSSTDPCKELTKFAHELRLGSICDRVNPHSGSPLHTLPTYTACSDHNIQNNRSSLGLSIPDGSV